uniref:Uncharacterized protein n=1 Tax=Arundo donax TaxID=35708 RepID=A0A0A9BYP3_ARUDO
MGTSKTRLSR